MTTPVPHHSSFYGWMPFLPPNQQRQSTAGKSKHHLQPILHWNMVSHMEACYKHKQKHEQSKTQSHKNLLMDNLLNSIVVL